MPSDYEVMMRNRKLKRRRQKRIKRLIKNALYNICLVLLIVATICVLFFIGKKIFVKEKPITIEQKVVLQNLDK